MNIHSIILEALGEASALFMRETEIVMPTTELEKIADKANNAISQSLCSYCRDEE